MAEPHQDANWHAVQVWTSREQWVATQLERRYVEGRDDEGRYLRRPACEEVYLPQAQILRRWSDRLKALPEPVFPGYLFARFAPKDRTAVLKVPGVFHVVGDGMPDQEVERIRLMVDSGLPLSTIPELVEGQTVLIDAGPLAGLEAVVVRKRRSARVIVSVPLLGRSVEAEVDLDDLEPIRDARQPLAVAA